jgi:hypothetical protein
MAKRSESENKFAGRPGQETALFAPRPTLTQANRLFF